MHSRASKSNPLDKKIPRNAKYENVEATIDTGSSVTKYMKKLEEKNKYYNFRKDELFKRMKVSTFVHMVVQVESANQYSSDAYSNNSPIYENEEAERESRADTEVADEELGNLTPHQRVETSRSTARSDADSVISHRSTLQSVIRGVGEVDIRTPVVEPIDANIEQPYLILDVRDIDDYQQCHIITARNYPPAMLSRSFNPETNEMRSFRNAQGRIIVLYDEDERLASHAATILVQRGYENVFMLSGGLKIALKCFPKGLVTGTPPAKLLAEIAPGGKTSRSSRAGDTNRSVLSSKVDFGPADQTEFSEEDINELRNNLDDIWNNSSRMSSSRTGSSVYSRASCASSKPPFR